MPLDSWDLLRTIWARSASCSRDFILRKRAQWLDGQLGRGAHPLLPPSTGLHLAALHRARFSASSARRSAGDRARSGTGSSGLCMRIRSWWRRSALAVLTGALPPARSGDPGPGLRAEQGRVGLGRPAGAAPGRQQSRWALTLPCGLGRPKEAPRARRCHHRWGPMGALPQLLPAASAPSSAAAFELAGESAVTLAWPAWPARPTQPTGPSCHCLPSSSCIFRRSSAPTRETRLGGPSAGGARTSSSKYFCRSRKDNCSGEAVDPGVRGCGGWTQAGQGLQKGISSPQGVERLGSACLYLGWVILGQGWAGHSSKGPVGLLHAGRQLLRGWWEGGLQATRL